MEFRKVRFIPSVQMMPETNLKENYMKYVRTNWHKCDRCGGSAGECDCDCWESA